MNRQVTVTTAAGAQRGVRLIGYPDQCPRCHSRQVPKLVGTVATSDNVYRDVEEGFQCTHAQCGSLFIAIYLFDHPDSPPAYKFLRAIPLKPENPQLPELVTSLSPTFSETYAQALVAESLNLTQLTGIGLRKALEFLVKDFAVTENPNDRETILKKPLATCIRDYIGDASVRETATRATWLGNDETHYLRKWEDRDVGDLKVLIRLTINGIENILLARKYITEMPAK